MSGVAGTRSTLSMLRHDLRTPLGQVIGYAELLIEEGASGERSGWDQALGELLLEARQALAETDRCFDALQPGEAPDPGRLAQVLATHRSRMAAILSALQSSLVPSDPSALAEDLENIAAGVRNLERLLAR